MICSCPMRGSTCMSPHNGRKYFYGFQLICGANSGSYKSVAMTNASSCWNIFLVTRYHPYTDGVIVHILYLLALLQDNNTNKGKITEGMLFQRATILF